MAFPETGVIETFTGSDSTSPPNADWTNDYAGAGGGHSIQILSNTAAGAANTLYNTAWYSRSTFGPNTEAYITISTVAATGEFMGLLVRGQVPGTAGLDGYELDVGKTAGTDTFELYRVDNTAYTLLGASVAQEFASGDAFGVRILGQTLNAYRKASGGSWGASLITRIDPTYAGSGSIGIAVTDDTTGRMDDFGGGTVPHGPPAYISSGTAPRTTGTGTGTTSCAPDYPTSLPGDLLLMQLHVKPDTATAPTVTDWTKVPNGETAGGGGTTGTDTGPTRLCWYYREVGATPPTGTITVTPGNSPNCCMAWMHLLRGGGAGSVWSVEGANGIDTTTGTPFTAAMGANPGITEDDLVMVAGGIPTDVSTPAQFSAETLTATGLTSGPVIEVDELETTSAQDLGGLTCFWTPTGTASDVATFSATAGGTTTNVRGPICLVRARWSEPFFYPHMAQLGGK